ncbi:MAG: ubiquitin-conjugating enzyme E2, partial [Planctomycetota bacterium]
LQASLQGKPRIQIIKTIGNPPEKYHLEYLVRSLAQVEGKIRERQKHHVEIVLTRAYPRQSPQCRMLTPVFHPNIAPHAICVGDHWAASETLNSLVARIGEILAFQSYNLKSPLNGEAARWVAENEDKAPLDDFDFSTLVDAASTATSIAGGAAATEGTGACANCGKVLPAAQLRSFCAARHLSCRDCVIPCASCKSVVCMRCRSEPCGTCKKLACLDCLAVCVGCKKTTCATHRAACTVCTTSHCDDCVVPCLRCRKPACLEHVVAVKSRGGHVCKRCADELRAARAAAPPA